MRLRYAGADPAPGAPAGLFALRFWHLLVYRRVSGLGAEAAFWLVFSLPWLRIRLMSVALLVGGGLLLGRSG